MRFYIERHDGSPDSTWTETPAAYPSAVEALTYRDRLNWAAEHRGRPDRYRVVNDHGYEVDAT